MNNQVKELMETVVSNDYCVGCGICAALDNSPLTMVLDENGQYKPVYNPQEQIDKMEVDVLKVCPFSNDSKDESELGEELYGAIPSIKHNEYEGYFVNNYAAYVKSGDYRSKGSSGGMGNWIASKLLETNMVDGVIHVKDREDKENSDILFEYKVSFNRSELEQGAKSKYYPIELSNILNMVKDSDKKYAIIGVPCFLKSVRLLASEDARIKERIKFYVGLVCGHLKSDMFAKSMGWQMGINPEHLETIDFRKKLENKAANNYGVQATGYVDDKLETKISATKDLYTTNWGQGFFRYNACEFCDDVLAETADVTVGDAWLPKYSNDSQGTNIVIVRNPLLNSLILDNKNELFLEELSEEKIYQSQASGLKHRREGLSYRLYLKDREGVWRPKKRVNPSNKISKKRKEIYVKRMRISQESFKAFRVAQKSNDFNVFREEMKPLINDYEKIAGTSLLRKTLRKVKRGIYEIKNR
ncbi:Coenzyme F420-reducing hydrogenase, beta subunit [Terribacillus aidingensis]|uniref:Coenzyme F420-reducing hydrogenase, beta subunit n=1 Tax=Terribacillus aidingensis TaxID=586416 RepID=A0A285N5R9_9BACI|nr:Coenzyme F420 hydrogenase/dehydrogenase, beta subunit C-terminal domain [Terribacillus aidingensis]SNZ04792.1 Coenzyme F420-reducing hydrogenase, beta subunit [Terribacillus aidingensis]